jgi:hypothetical protein
MPAKSGGRRSVLSRYVLSRQSWRIMSANVSLVLNQVDRIAFGPSAISLITLD